MADDGTPPVPTGDGTPPVPTGDAAPPAHPGELDLRASHADRDRIVELLRVSAGDGRLSIDELDERVEAALTARTYRELVALVLDLPAAPGATRGVPAAKPKELVRIDCRSGSTKRDGRCAVPQRMEVQCRSGSVTLDFTEAVVTWPTLQIDADVHSGILKLVTKPGIVLDTDDVSVHSGEVKVKAPWGPDVPATLRIDVSGQVRSGTLAARPPRPPRRSFWDWLRRRPRPGVPYEIPPGRS